ncbi:hypothetical protein Dsin_006124 [Dipteronia sinensis]|uniref:Uncharacterized protein n=1 Tax=Dipteronia sinensis TaxID=43782 RepID=A0AAE0AY49_9ROSI|nr:hypothetical protein Dsin_006124 [Dipteronia sinensis]
MALINVLLEFTSPNQPDINVTESSFSWVQANLPAIPYQVIMLDFFRGCWPDRHSLLYYLIILTVFLFAVLTGLVTGAPMPTDADNSLINEAIEKASLLCFIFLLSFFAIAFPVVFSLAAIAGYALGFFTGSTIGTHRFVIVRWIIVLVRLNN